jgi:hypothetical protein
MFFFKFPETKWKYDVAPEEKQVVWKQMILNFMERFVFLLFFSMELFKENNETNAMFGRLL